MKLQTMILLAVLAVAAASSLLLIPERGDKKETHPLLLPTLTDEKLSTINHIKITSSKRKIDLKRDAEEHWKVSQAEDYPATLLRIRDILLFMAEARKVEARTSDSNYYSRLGLEDPSSEEGGGTLVKLANDADEEWELIVGNFSKQLVTGQNVRIVGEEQSWLINKRILASAELNDWLEPDLAHIPHEEIQNITAVRHEDNKALTISRETKDQPLTMTNDSDSEKKISQFIPQIATIAEYMKYRRLILSAEAEIHSQILAKPKISITFTSYDGLKLTIHSYQWGATSLFNLRAETTDSATESSKDAAKEINNITHNRFYEMLNTMHIAFTDGMKEIFDGLSNASE